MNVPLLLVVAELVSSDGEGVKKDFQSHTKFAQSRAYLFFAKKDCPNCILRIFPEYCPNLFIFCQYKYKFQFCLGFRNLWPSEVRLAIRLLGD